MLTLLEPFDSLQYLAHLVCLGLSFVILNIDAGISGPRRLEHRVTGAGLTRLAEEFLATLNSSMNLMFAGPLRICSRIFSFIDSMVPLMAPLFK
jgi:hypothetical protein